MRALQNRKGFTLIELVVAMVVFAILGGAVAGVLNTGLSSYGRVSDDMYNETDARTALSLITVQIRQHDATDAITVDSINKIIRLRDNPTSSTDLSGTVIWFSTDTLYAAEVDDVGTLPNTADAATIAEIYNLELKQDVPLGGTALQYTVKIKYSDGGGKELLQTVTQRSAPAEPTTTP